MELGTGYNDRCMFIIAFFYWATMLYALAHVALRCQCFALYMFALCTHRCAARRCRQKQSPSLQAALSRPPPHAPMRFFAGGVERARRKFMERRGGTILPSLVDSGFRHGVNRFPLELAFAFALRASWLLLKVSQWIPYSILLIHP